MAAAPFAPPPGDPPLDGVASIQPIDGVVGRIGDSEGADHSREPRADGEPRRSRRGGRRRRGRGGAGRTGAATTPGGAVQPEFDLGADGEAGAPESGPSTGLGSSDVDTARLEQPRFDQPVQMSWSSAVDQSEPVEEPSAPLAETVSEPVREHVPETLADPAHVVPVPADHQPPAERRE